MCSIFFWRNKVPHWLCNLNKPGILIYMKKIMSHIISAEKKWSTSLFLQHKSSTSLFLQEKMKRPIISSEKISIFSEEIRRRFIFFWRNINNTRPAEETKQCASLFPQKKIKHIVIFSDKMKPIIISSEKNAYFFLKK